jgi:hypothetical protein
VNTFVGVLILGALAMFCLRRGLTSAACVLSAMVGVVLARSGSPLATIAGGAADAILNGGAAFFKSLGGAL